MRPRRAARKSYTEENIYDSESSPEEPPAPASTSTNTAAPKKRRGRPPKKEKEDDDYDFAKDADQDVEMLDEDPDVDLDHGTTKTPKRVTYRAAKSAAATHAGNIDLVGIPLAAQDAEAAKGYVGTTDRGVHGKTLTSSWYGPDEEGLEVVDAMQFRWGGWKVLPPKGVPEGYPLPDVGLWLGDREGYYSYKLAGEWTKRLDKGKVVKLKSQDAMPYKGQEEVMEVSVGDPNSPTKLQMLPGQGVALSQAGIPYDEDDQEEKVPTGWMFDVGGIPLSMDWAPREDPKATQMLAVAVIPYKDHGMYDFLDEYGDPDFQRHGAVQLWELPGQKDKNDYTEPAPTPPKLKWTLCIEHGRARRVSWSPLCECLAIICGDGRVCIVDGGQNLAGYNKLVEPAATLRLTSEPFTKATTMTWITINRLAVGYSDGTIGLWSIAPCRLLSRTAVHHSAIIDMASGAPTRPYMIASYPIGGNYKLVDLRSPSQEATEVQMPLINPQPGLLGWCDHLLGFISLYASPRIFNTTITFHHYAHFPIPRTVCTEDSLPTSVAVGKRHPYLLVGTLDGSVRCMNPLAELLSTRYATMDKLRVFQHEHVSARFAPGTARGRSRVLTGFALESNERTEEKPTKKKAKKKGEEEQDEDGKKIYMNDAGTRITSIVWNPNEGFGTWAAAGMASGLVRVMDLGINVA